MIRIKRDKCGFNGYTCVGLPKLRSEGHMFNSATKVEWEETINEVVTGFTTTVGALDSEFNKIPVKIKGMVFTTITIDMGWIGNKHPEIPELTCRSDTDPFSDTDDVSYWGNSIPVEISGDTYQYPVFGGTSGWVDLFNAEIADTNPTQYFYRDKVFILVDGSTYTHITDVTNNVPVFKTSYAELEFNPGLLEPMLDTDFDPIQIDQIPAWEAGDDSFIFTAQVINGWKGIIDGRFNDVYHRINTIPVGGDDLRLRDLKSNEYKESECQNFRITLEAGGVPVKTVGTVDHGQTTSSGTALPTIEIPGTGTTRPIQYGDILDGATVINTWKNTSNNKWYWTVEGAGANLYDISGGDVRIGGFECHIDGVNGLHAPFYAYVTTSAIYTKTSSAADLPTVPDGNGGTRPCNDGDILEDGGRVINVGTIVVGGTTVGTTVTGGTTLMTWEEYYTSPVDAGGSVCVVGGSDLGPDQVYDPPAGDYGIGGVRVISGGTSTDSYVLYKVYHEDCLTSMSLNTGAMVNHLYPNYTEPEKGGPEHDPGIVWPYDNVVSGATVGTVIPGSTNTVENGWGGYAYVPTVEAVWDFVHGWNTGISTDGPRAVYGDMYDDGEDIYMIPVAGATSYLPGTVVVTDSILSGPYGYGGKIITAQDVVPTAQAVVDYVLTHAGSTVNDAVAGYIDITGEDPNDTDSLLSFEIPSGTEGVAGTTVTPVAGIVQPSHNIQLHTTADKRSASPVDVPTVEAVYNFVHSLSGSTDYADGVGFPVADAKATPTAMSPASTQEVTPITYTEDPVTHEQVPTQGTPYTVTTSWVARGTPGTFYVASDIQTVTDNGVISSDAGSVPTADAVAKYVARVVPGQTSDSVSGTLKVTRTEDTSTNPATITISEGWNDPAPIRGTVEVAKGILVAADPVNRVLTQQAVPSVNAVYTFVHSTTEDVSGATASVQALAFRDAITVAAGQNNTESESIGSALPGTTYVVTNVQVASTRSASLYVVPTVVAIYDFIHNPGPGGSGEPIAKALATGQVITSPIGEGNTVATLTSGAVPGTCFVVTDMLGMTGSGVTLNTSYTVNGVACTLESVVPTVEAVKGYVDANAGGSMAVLGHLTVNGSGDESLVAVTGGSTPAAGKLYVSENIDYSSTANKQIQSKLTVPNVIAVDEYTHSAKAKATAGTMTGTTSISLSGGTPGTVAVASNILTATGSTTTADCVPTAQAVVDYVENHSGGGTGEGVPWPNYASLGSSGGLLWVRTNYHVTVGGWLRISFRGNRITGCYSVTIDNTQIGMMQMDSADTGQFGQTFFMPIQTGSTFWVEFPSTGTRIWFDGVCENAVTGADERHSESLHAAVVGSTDSYGSFDSSAAATEAENIAQNAVGRAHSAANYAADYATDASEYAGYAHDDSIEASEYADLAVAATTESDAADYYWQTYDAVDACSGHTANVRDYARYARREANDAVNAVRDAQAAGRWTSVDLSSYVESAEDYRDSAVASAEEAEGYNEDATADLASANASLARALAAVRVFDPDFGN